MAIEKTLYYLYKKLWLSKNLYPILDDSTNVIEKIFKMMIQGEYITGKSLW